MKQRKVSFLILTIVLNILAGCAKGGGPTDVPGIKDLRGVLLYNSGEHTYKFDLSDHTRSIYFERNSYSLNGWDVSWDGGVRLETATISGEFDKVRFKLVDPENNTLIKQFDYEKPNGEDRAIWGTLSPDKSLIMIQPDFDHGIVIIDTDGHVKYHLHVVNETELTLGDAAHWLPGNGIVFTFENFVLKSDPPYTSITQVKKIEKSDWGNLHVNQEGSKLSLRIDKHIYMMDIDGTNFVQVTESEHQEWEAVFSPDGRYLLVAANYYPGTFHSGKWDLNIIPADGAKYKVGRHPGQGVYVVRMNGKDIIETASEPMYWR